MSEQVQSKRREADSIGGILELTAIDIFPENAVPALWWIGEYKYRYTTGPFLLPQNSGSLDWILLNNDATQQKARVTIFKCELSTTKCPEAPGPLVVTLEPGETTHNANKYVEGFVYEVQVECNSQLVFPYVSIWPANFGVVIPGTEITSQAFVRLMP
jgi:hypothetical protein